MKVTKQLMNDIDVVLQLAEDELNNINRDAHNGDEDAVKDHAESGTSLHRVKLFIDNLIDGVAETGTP